MFKKINLNIIIFLTVIILSAAAQLSYADGNSFTVNVPNSQGGYTAIVITQSGDGYVGPQGEYYASFPSVAQLQAVYATGTPAATLVTDTGATDTDDSSSTTVTVTVAPPALPEYEQPEPPSPEYIWTPGYWAYDSFFEDYYWVPGTWVTAPTPGYLWTPGYWYWREGHFIFSDGYWGVHIGFYGGVCYGHGYEGRGFSGGGWQNGTFVNKRINETNVTNITNITNITNNTTNDITNNTSSFNGGPGGTQAKPTPEEQVAMNEKHIPLTSEQRMHVHGARNNPALRASANHGKPAIAATARPGVFKGKGVVAAKQAGAFYNKTKPKAITNRNTLARSLANPGARQLPALQRNKTLTKVPSKPKVKPKVVKKQVVKKPVPTIPPANGDNAQTKNSQNY